MSLYQTCPLPVTPFSPPSCHTQLWISQSQQLLRGLLSVPHQSLTQSHIQSDSVSKLYSHLTSVSSPYLPSVHQLQHKLIVLKLYYVLCLKSMCRANS